MIEAQTSVQSARLKAFLLGLEERTSLLMSIFFSNDFVMAEENPKLHTQVLKQRNCFTYPVTAESYLTAGGGVEGISLRDLILESWHYSLAY